MTISDWKTGLPPMDGTMFLAIVRANFSNDRKYANPQVVWWNKDCGEFRNDGGHKVEASNILGWMEIPKYWED